MTTGEATSDISEVVIRERVLAGAQRCFDRFGVEKTTMGDIAKAADISRATVYRYFDGGRDEIVIAVLRRDFQRLVPQIRQILDQARPLADRLTDVFMHTLTFVRHESHPALMAYVEPRASMAKLDSIPRAVFTTLVSLADQDFEAARLAGVLRDNVTVEDTVELLTRMLFSMLLMPGHIERSAAEERAFVHTYVVSAIAQ